MENTINYGIDLGTTNSVIAKFVNGKIEIFENPSTQNITLPSIVGFQENSIYVGEKAKEFLEKKPQNVIGSFKRKMGTSETFKINANNKELTPIELSANVLKELKTFIQTYDAIDAAVITIPASFDTIQSNATKEAGYMAGFRQVILLQEPIAASLAYVNKFKKQCPDNGYWLVYDLGGGTFDVALVKVSDEEMKITDHEGDNFLGGKDFDAAIIEKKVIPWLEQKYTFTNLGQELKSASGKYNRQWHIWMNKAEQAKIALSRNDTAEIKISIIDDNHFEINETIRISRKEFESLVVNEIDETIRMIKRILERNSLTNNDISFVLMIGSSTNIPFVGNRVEEELKIKVNDEIDPTTAIAIGAAYYAGTREKNIELIEEIKNGKPENQILQFEISYEKTSRDINTFFTAKLENSDKNMYYSIIREDGGFTTGIKPFSLQITENLPLMTDSYNFFKLKIFNKKNNRLKTNIETICIAQGKYNIAGQPLPEDICLELDDFQNEKIKTKLHLLFLKNSVLPVHKTETRIVNNTIKKGSDDRFIINVLEGPATSIPIANKTIGFMAIKGANINRDLIKGADVELTFEISESRDLKIIAYIPMLNQEFERIFTPTKRHLPVQRLKDEIHDLSEFTGEELESAIHSEDYETAELLKVLKNELNIFEKEAGNLTDDDITDKRYQLEDKKRSIALNLYLATKNKYINRASRDYFEEKIQCQQTVENDGNDNEKRRYKELAKKEGAVLSSGNPQKIRKLTNELLTLRMSVLWRAPWYNINVFEWLKSCKKEFSDFNKGKGYINSGHIALEKQNYTWLKQININLLDLLPKAVKEEAIKRGTGLV